VKLAKELSRRATGTHALHPRRATTGLHFEDVRKLLEVLHRLVEGGNTVVVIEHNLEVIKTPTGSSTRSRRRRGRRTACGGGPAGGDRQGGGELHRPVPLARHLPRSAAAKKRA